MPTMIYSPMIEVRIATTKHGIVDVSEDISRGSLRLAENSMAILNITLINHMRKYDGVFTPNDRITVKLKRIRWLQVFSGYLNEVPYFSIFPRDVVLGASCTLKRLMHRPWDPGSQAAIDLLSTTGVGVNAQAQPDGGVRDKLVRLLTEVGGWPQENIHIGQIPHDWFTKVTKLAAIVRDQTAALDAALGTSASSGGQSTEADGTVTATDAPNQMCALPATSGRVSWFGGPQGGAYNGMALTGESGVYPANPWYCAMRWGYQGYVNGKITPYGNLADRSAAIGYLKNRKVIVSNPVNGKAVVVRAADWGPGGVKTADDRVIDISKQALDSLGLGTDDHVNVRWAIDQNMPLGPYTSAAATTTPAAPAMPSPNAVDRAATGTPAASDEQEARQAKAHARANAAEDAASKVLLGLPFHPVSDNGGTLQAHAHAAREFIEQNWPAVPHIGGYSYRKVAGTNTLSRHASGLALDVGMGTGGRMPTNEQIMLGNSIALWFEQNPDVFQIDQIIWMNQINTGSGWKLYADGKYRNDVNLGHFNHIHISFKRGTPPTSAGPTGNAWSGTPHPYYAQGFAQGKGLTPSGGQGTSNLLALFNWEGGPDPRSQLLTGPRALLNDEPLLNTVQRLSGAGMRNYMAGPNGDFIAWFPDHFDNYGTAAKLHISDVELAGDGFTVQHSDEHLITHQFTAGTWLGTSQYGGSIDAYSEIHTQGIVTVELPGIMQALFNIDPGAEGAEKFLNAVAILDRYGARPDFQPLGTIQGPQAEFWYAIKLFTQNWAQQFSSQVNTTFLPEAWPGMIAVVDSMRFQAYISAVTHSWDFEGEGFATSLSIVAPSALEGGLLGLPRAGGIPQRGALTGAPVLDDV